jgi:hypothetical protein
MNISDLKKNFSEKEILTSQQAYLVKGGDGEDDDEKRRERPGGGITNHRPASPGNSGIILPPVPGRP